MDADAMITGQVILTLVVIISTFFLRRLGMPLMWFIVIGVVIFPLTAAPGIMAIAILLGMLLAEVPPFNRLFQ